MEHMSWWWFRFSDLSCLWNQFLHLTQVQPQCCCIWGKNLLPSFPSFFVPSLFLNFSVSLCLSLIKALTKGRISEFSGSPFSSWKLGEWVLLMLVLGRERRTFLGYLPIFHLCFYGWWCGAGWEKLLPWLQAIRKQKRWLWCHNCGRGAGLGKSWEAISIPPVFSWGLFPCGIQWSRHFPWLKLPSPQLVT